MLRGLGWDDPARPQLTVDRCSGPRIPTLTRLRVSGQFMHVLGSNAGLLFADPGQDPRILPREANASANHLRSRRYVDQGGGVKIALCPFLALSPPVHHLRQVRLICPRDTRTARMCVCDRPQGAVGGGKGKRQSPKGTTVRAEGRSLTHFSPTSGWLRTRFTNVASPRWPHRPFTKAKSTLSSRLSRFRPRTASGTSISSKRAS